MRSLRQEIASIPIIGPAARTLSRSLAHPNKRGEFRSSQSYWKHRYDNNGNSGAGSYGRLAAFKAETISDYVARHSIASVIEFGCGDGAQLSLTDYPYYIGVDVSMKVIELCGKRFANDPSKSFMVLEEFDATPVTADMSMSLDVIYHLVEERTYHDYMHRLVQSAERSICIYSSNVQLPGHVSHIRHRRFTDWFDTNAPEWKLVKTVRNRYPYDFNNPDETSWADFYFFER
ncbi:MAG TPA: hypothetical protein VFW94_04965 [Candidatus Acidoferrales bacterium]|nr:hypothetical protein [Candidatus Acidoferrales bacterium]